MQVLQNTLKTTFFTKKVGNHRHFEIPAGYKLSSIVQNQGLSELNHFYRKHIPDFVEAVTSKYNF